jgi:uncharacterized protein DUF4157
VKAALVAPVAATPTANPAIQRCGLPGCSKEECGEHKNDVAKIRRAPTQPSDGAPNAPTSVAQVLRRPGKPLPDHIRASMERRLGHDFSHVRIHSDREAASSAQAIKARAYTAGSHIVFGAVTPDLVALENTKLLAHELTHVIQQRNSTLPSSEGLRLADDTVHEREAESAAAELSTGLHETSPLTSTLSTHNANIQRAATDATTGTGLIVEDGAVAAVGAMHKTEFVSQLDAELCRAVEDGFRGSQYEGRGCPFLARSMERLGKSPAREVEAIARRAAAATTGGTSARQLIPPIVDRVKQSVARFVQTGDITGVPPELADLVPDAFGGGGIFSMLSGGIGGLFSGIGRVVGGGLSALGSVLFLPHGTTEPPAPSPTMVRAEISGGRPLDAHAQSRMEPALGHSLTHVRVHDDAGAASLASRLGARAFTIGSDIAFAPGQYAPGTVVGDAVLAHELAHVVQQGDAGTSSLGEVEDEADAAALSTVASLWDDSKIADAQLRRVRRPRLRTGLSLQRCAYSEVPRCAPGAAAPGRAPAGQPNPEDQRARTIIEFAKNTSVPAKQRAVQTVIQIVCAYYPEHVALIKKVKSGGDRGLQTASEGEGPDAQGTISVSEDFLNEVTPDKFARRVLQVGHELRHVEQYREGLTGDENKALREFQATSENALANEFAGTGRMEDVTLRPLIDGALGWFYCMTPEQQAAEASTRDQLLARRRQVPRASRYPLPTECQRSD